MTNLPDLEELSFDQRTALAAKVKSLSNFTLPELKYWNSHPCAAHKELQFTCKECGVRPMAHQAVGSTWLFLNKKGLLADSVGTGKSLAISEPVLTPTGWAKMGDLKVGDSLVDPEGDPSEVTGVYPQGVKPLYEITFSDGTKARSSMDHLWKTRGQTGSVQNYLTRVSKEPRSRDPWSVRTLGEIKEYLESGKRSTMGAIPLVSVPPDLGGNSNLPLDPYLLGLLLGDGSFRNNSVSFSTADEELRVAVEFLIPADCMLKHADKYDYYITCTSSRNSINSIVKELGLWNHLSYEKFVPEQFKWTSAANRLALLQGLMDTDGTIDKSGHATEFSTISERLADDVVWLAHSLGLRVKKTQRITSYTYKGEKKQGRLSYRVRISERDDFRIFRLARKLEARNERQFKTNKKYSQPVKWIRSIECVGEEEQQCISVSAPSHLYVTDNWTVTHNTINLSLLIAMMAQAGELDSGRRVVIVVRSAAILQWERELQRTIPSLNVIKAVGSTQARLSNYLKPWQILIIGKEMALQDWEALEQFPIAALIMDDVDALRNRTKIAHALKKLARNAPRVVVANGTPLQKRLPELYHTLEPLGARALFGTEGAFKMRYMDVDGGNRPVYKNMADFKAKIDPLVLRRTTSDLDGVDMPDVMSSTVWLDLHPAQRVKYEELRNGVLKILKESSGTEEVKRIQALQKFHYGAAVCSGLVAIGEEDVPTRNSSKLDWIMNALDTELSEDKVLIFLATKRLLTAAESRIARMGIGTAKIWGEDNNRIRQEEIDRFWQDEACKVMLVTQAGESSLNLQNSRHVILTDTILNPARMEQIVGRVRRQGSTHKTVYVHHLLTTDTQESRYLDSLRREAALAGAVWNSTNEIFAPLSPLEMLQLIRG